MKITKFEDLKIWQISLSLVKEVYTLTKKENFQRDFSLCVQIRRSVASISCNIVEGFEKNNNNDFIWFLKIAKGSLGEARNQLYIAKELDYVSGNEFKSLNSKLINLANKIGALISYLTKKKIDKEFVPYKPTRNLLTRELVSS